MSDRDDTPTWRKNKPRIQTSDDRDAAAIKHRHTSAVGIPVPTVEDDPENMTGPFDLFDLALADRRKRPGDSVAELAAKLRRERPDPYDLVAMLAFEHVDATKRDRSANQELDKQFRAFMAQQPGGKDFESIAETVRFARKIGWLVIAGLASSIIGAAIYLGDKISTASELRGATAVRIESLERENRQLGQDIRDLRRERKDTP